MFEHVNSRDWLRWTLVFLLLALSIAYLNRDYSAERRIFQYHHIQMAEHLLGEVEREITTYPLWGYPLLICAVGAKLGLGMLQWVASSAALALFLLVLRGAFPEHRRLLSGILIAAVPWYFLHSVHWPNSPAAVLLLCASLALLYSNETKRLGWAVVGGALLGLSLNFRSDGLLLPVAVGFLWLVGWAFRRATRPRGGDALEPANLDLRALLAFACVSWLMLVPWATHYHAETGHYSMTSSNGGMVALISLGQLPENPWGVVHQDAYATEVLQSEGVQVPAWSDSANELLMQRFRQNVESHPGAYVRKILQNLRSMLIAGFYVGDAELAGDEHLQLDVMREHIKLTLGVNPNLREIEEYKRSGVWENPQPGGRAVALMVWQLIGGALGALFLLIALSGMLSAATRILREPLLLICAAAVLYQIALVGALQYQPRHMNGVFVFLVPFFVIAVERMRAVVGRFRSPAFSA